MKNLTYKNIDYSNKLLKFNQNKTKGHSSNSGVVLPLNEGLLSIIGEAPTEKRQFDIQLENPPIPAPLYPNQSDPLNPI